MFFTPARPQFPKLIRPLLHIWLQDPVWWRKVHWLRPHLRYHGLRQEVRAQIQVAEAGCDRGQDQGQPQAEEGEEEQDQEGARYRQSQGRPSWKEVRCLALLENRCPADSRVTGSVFLSINGRTSKKK